jgi:hypothetical protein
MMSSERISSFSPTIEEPEPANKSEVIAAADFDLSSFFETPETDVVEARSEAEPLSENQQAATQPEIDLLVTLRNDAAESIGTITSKVTAQTFAVGADFTANIFSLLSSMAGSCGIFCGHALSTISSAGTGMQGLASMGGVSSPTFNIDRAGNFHLDGNIDTISRATGIPKADLLSGKYSPEDIFAVFLSAFGTGINNLFGFGLVEVIITCMFDCVSNRTATNNS